VTTFVGVDGCKLGWFAVWQSPRRLKSQIYPSAQDLWREHADATRILIDVPIGLKVSEDRAIESEVRALLGPRRSSVFPVPCSAAAYADNYPDASAINRSVLGKGLSKQAWFITPMIRDVDQLLQQNRQAKFVIGECHPELAFATLNGAPLENSKKTPEGLNVRQALIRKYFPAVDRFLDSCLRDHPRRHLQLDDCLDALILLITAKQARPLSDSNESGEGGIPIRMWVPDRVSYY
jgi:predicted RNase H-like nuclease